MKTGVRTKIVNLVKKAPTKTQSISDLYKVLKVTHPEITKQQIKKELRDVIRFDSDRRKYGKSLKYFIMPNKGGNSFRYIGGGENTRKYTGTYREVCKVIDGNAKNIAKMFGAPHLNSFDVHAGRSKRGKWGRPDVIVALYRGIGSSRPFALHSIEFEGKGGLSPANIAQARFSGAGADKCWLLFDSRDWPKNASQRKKNPSAPRILEFAKKLGVGLIYYRNISRSSEWIMLEPAKQQKKRRKNDYGFSKEREALRELFEGELKTRRKKTRKLNK
jgi:hypothetical protein